MTPAILLKQKTRELLAVHFGQNKPFFVVRKDSIVEAGKSFADRVYFSNGTTTITVPNIQGLNLGEAFYMAEDGDMYEWQKHFDVTQTECSNHQQEAIAFALRPL